MTIDFIQIEMFAILIAAGISTCIWGIWEIIYTLAQKLEKAIQLLKQEYANAQASDFVNKPMSYALYQVWKKFDSNESSIKNNKEGKSND